LRLAIDVLNSAPPTRLVAGTLCLVITIILAINFCGVLFVTIKSIFTPETKHMSIIGLAAGCIVFLVALRIHALLTGIKGLEGITRFGDIKVKNIQQHRKSKHRDDGVRQENHIVFRLWKLYYGIYNIISIYVTFALQ
jgi:hypothetical protein